MLKFLNLIVCNHEKKIEGFEDYLIDTSGRIFRISTQKEIKNFINKSTGYLHINIYNDHKKPIQKQVHRLVAIHFIPNPKNKKCVNHKDSNRVNNNVNNLEWVNHSENNYHAYKKGFKKPPLNNLPDLSTPIIGTNIKTEKIIKYNSMGKASKDGFFTSSLSLCCNNKQKFHKGYYWKFDK